MPKSALGVDSGAEDVQNTRAKRNQAPAVRKCMA